MSTDSVTKINQLLNSTPKGIVYTSSWLTKLGYSLDLQKRYRRSNWLESVGYGAMKRRGDKIDYTGAIYALQKQLNMSVHPGGRTALALQGRTHYLELYANRTIIGSIKEKLPSWWNKSSWSTETNYYTTSFLPEDLGFTNLELGEYSIKVSTTARAILECIYLSPKQYDIVECYAQLEGLNNMRPDQIQLLLENCSSIKVKRLFLYLAKKAGHSWVQYLNLERIDLGKGKRSLAKNGIYIKEFKITVPKVLADEQL